MHRKKPKGNKKKAVKSKVKKVKATLTVGQASTTVENDNTHIKNLDTMFDQNKLLKRAVSDKKSSFSKKKLKRKRRTSTSDPSGYPCMVCGMAYKTTFTLRRHLEYYGDPTYPCEECGTKFANEKQLEYHIAQAHAYKNLRKYKYQCPVCYQFVILNDHLRSHMYHYHEGWESAYPDLFATEPETVTIATLDPIQKYESKLEDKEEDSTVRQSQMRTKENIEDCTNTHGNNGNNSSLTITLENDSSSTIPLENNASSEISLENDISENISPEQNISLTKRLESDVTAEEAAEINITERRSLEDKITETKATKNNTTETKASEITATAPTIGFQNRIKEEEKKSNESSRVDDETVSPDEKNTPSQNISVESDVPINDTSPSSIVKIHVELNKVKDLPSDTTTAAPKKKDKNKKSPDGSKRPKEATKSDKNRSIKTNSANDVTLIAGESNRDEAAEDNDIINENDRESKLKALYSCKDCYIPLARLDVKRKRVRVPPSMTEPRSLAKLIPSIHRVSRPSIDLSKVKPKYRKIVSGPSTPFPCKLCDEFFDTHASRLMHVELRHTIIPSIVCDKNFTTRHAMLRHYRQRHFVYSEKGTFCVCGMELVGQTAIHQHFYRFAVEVRIVPNLPTATFTACNPLPTKFDCEKCGAKFWLKSCLLYHLTLKCKPPKKLPTAMNVRKRYKRFANEPRPHVCTVCDTAFHTAQQLLKHEATYTRPGIYPCTTCGTVFGGHRQLSGHVQTTHERDPAKWYPFYCGICDQGFNQPSSERIHRMHFHTNKIEEVETSDSDLEERSLTDTDESDDESTKECNVCGSEFTSGHRFINHLIYYTKSETVECSMCLEEFEGQYKAHRHNKLVHYSSDSKNAFTHHCTICQEGFMWETHLHAHICHVHGVAAIEARRITNQANSKRSNSQKVGFLNVADTCKTCDVSFPSPVLLAAHEIENLNDGEFVCNKCSRKCRTASILLDHLSLNHSSTAIQDGVKCRRCWENFQTRSTWVSHVKHFHFTKEPSEFYFEKNFTSSEKLRRNLRHELTVPSNYSIKSGIASLRIKSSIGGTPFAPATMNNIYGNAVGRNFIKFTEPNSAADRRINRKLNGVGHRGPWKCTICALSCRGPAELARHMALFSDNGHYMCEYCGRRFAWLSICQNHEKKHYRSRSDKFFCATCDEGFETLQSQLSHEVHLHNKAVQPEEGNISDAQQSKSSSHPRPLLPPKLPSIISFFQSDAANEPASNQPGLSLPEGSLEEYDEESNSPRLHTEIFEDELSMTYQCPNCQEKYPTLEGLHEHLTIVHKMKQDPTEDSPDDSRTYVDSAKCEICDMNFATENQLSLHQKSIHSLGLVEINAINSTPIKSTAIKRECLSSETSLNSIIPTPLPLSPTQTEKPQSVGEAFSTTVKRDNVSDTSNSVQTDGAGQFRCDICDIVFMDNNVLRVHEVNVHCLTIDGNPPIDDTSKGENSCSSESAVGQLSLFVGNLPIVQEIVNGTAITIDFESIMLPVTTYDFNIAVPESENSTETLKSIDPSSNANTDSLPAGNNQISQLKVRPFAKIVENLRKQTVQKPRTDKPKESTEPPAKRVKTIFDPIVYRELCKQHNLVPPASTKSKASSKPPPKTPPKTPT